MNKINKIKYGLVGFIIGMVFMTIGVAAEQYVVNPNIFPIIVNGQQQNIDALNVNNQTYLQLRNISNVLNANINFDNNKKQIVINTKGVNKQMDVDTTTTTSGISPTLVTSPSPITSLNIVKDNNNNEFIEINNLSKWCYNQGFILGFNDLSQSVSKLSIYYNDPHKTAKLNYTANIYIMDGKFYVKYDLVQDIIISFIEKNK